MPFAAHALSDLEPKAAAGESFTRAEAERVAACPDLVSVGMLGEAARRAKHGPRVTFGRVLAVPAGAPPSSRGDAGEVRLSGAPASAADAVERVRAAAPIAAGAALTGFSLADLLALVRFDEMALVDLSAQLAAAGLDAVAEVPIDRLSDPAEAVRAAARGGLGAWRVTVLQSEFPARIDLIERVAALQRETGLVRAFAPLPRVDPRETPSTGYDDVKTIAIARLVCGAVPSIQVDWPLYGPKLAQVALAYGADDIDGVAAADTLNLGHRRSPREEIERHIRMAAAEPAERNGRYEIVA